MKLLDIQDDFQRIILNKKCAGASWVSQTDSLSTEDRLAIYHNAYRIRLADVLWDTFEHTATYLGDDWFHQLASAYVQSHHSVHNNIGLYGEGFASFLAQQLPDNDQEVSEIALLDWTLRRAFDGTDSDTMTQEHLQQMASTDPDSLTLHPVPTLSIVTHQFNTLDIWHAINQDSAPPLAQRLPQPIDIVIWRKEHSPHFRSLTAIESTAIKIMSRDHGCLLNTMGEELTQIFPQDDISTEFGRMLFRWTQDKVLAIQP
jgi:hypothetical protein